MTNDNPGGNTGGEGDGLESVAPPEAADWRPGDPAPEGYHVVPADADFNIPEHLAHAELLPGQEPAARAVATEELVCVVSGETIEVGEEYIDGGEQYGPVKLGHEHESKRLS